MRVAESALVAGKVVPAAPARRLGPAASYGELARVAARGWRPVESERLGEWELRAAAGFTRRANSVLPLGDPGLPLDDALTAVRGWYAARGLPAYVQTATGAEGTQELLCAELERRGWVREVTAELWTGGLAPVADLGDGTPGVLLSRDADEAWLARYRRKGWARWPCGCWAEDPRAPRPRVSRRCGSRPCRASRAPRRRPRSGGVSWTAGGRGSRRSRWIRRGGGRAWPRP